MASAMPEKNAHHSVNISSAARRTVSRSCADKSLSSTSPTLSVWSGSCWHVNIDPRQAVGGGELTHGHADGSDHGQVGTLGSKQITQGGQIPGAGRFRVTRHQCGGRRQFFTCNEFAGLETDVIHRIDVNRLVRASGRAFAQLLPQDFRDKGLAGDRRRDRDMPRQKHRKVMQRVIPLREDRKRPDRASAAWSA